MIIPLFVAAAIAAQSEIPPVPGLCSAPVPVNRETAGCYQTGAIELTNAPDEIYWHIYEYPSRAAADAEAGRHRWSSVAEAHARTWLYVLGAADENVQGGTKKAIIGPLKMPAATGVTAHFSEAIFPPGMRTRVHSHPGPEAFYVVEGVQCMETPTDKKMVFAGNTYIVASGPHIQAAPSGRRNLVLILAPQNSPFVIPGGDWRPSGFCNSQSGGSLK
jgi:quercetin dioxygenase-like cupin family protein